MVNVTDLQIDLFGSLNSLKNSVSGWFQNKNPEKNISPEFSPESLVSFRYNPRLKKSIRCQYNGLFGHPLVTLPAYMRNDDFVLVRELISQWAELSQKRKTAKTKASTKELLERIWAATDQVLSDRGEKLLESRGHFPPIRSKGKIHDLEQVLAAVNETYFKGELSCRITWSNRLGGMSFHTVRKDPYTKEPVHLISISQGYDSDNCPLYAVAGVVYHECLHIAIPPKTVGGRRSVHGRNFRQCEKRYIYYEEWMRWHREVLPKNIYSLRRIKKGLSQKKI